MKTLYLLRHAKSSWGDPTVDDFNRPLNDRGRKAAKLVARLMRHRGIRPQRVLCSAARRTRETCEALAAALADADVTFEKRLYEAGSDRLMARLRQLPDEVSSVMVIGHNPGLEGLARLLAGDGDIEAHAALRRKFPTAAMAVLDCPGWSDLGPMRCTLRDFIRPVDLADD